jgi:hypothetical protein
MVTVLINYDINIKHLYELTSLLMESELLKLVKHLPRASLRPC